MMTNKTQDRPAEYSCRPDRVLKGSVVLAWLRPVLNGLKAVTPNGRRIGVATTPAEAMLMVIRDHEGGVR